MSKDESNIVEFRRAAGADHAAPMGHEVPFRLLVESVADYAIYVLDPKGHVASWNVGAQRIKGYSADEIIGRHFSCFFPDEDVRAGKCERELMIAARDGRFEDEAWRVRKDGSRFWANVVLTRLVDGDGKLIGFAKVTRDLTERRKLEEERLARVRAQADAEAHFRLLVDSVVDYAIYTLDPKGNVTSWNSGAQRIKGYSADEIIGQHLSRFFPPEDVRAGKCDRELEVAAREGRFEDEAWRIRKDGSKFWANVVITRLLDDAGQLIGFAKVTRDLTDRRKAEEERLAQARAHAAAEAHLRSLLESVTDYAIYSLDPNGYVRSWNTGAERIKGYSADEIIGKHFSCFFPREDVHEGKCERELATAAREGRFEDEAWRVRKDGTRFWANVVITRVVDAEGNLTGFAKVTRDLTERRQLEEAHVARARAETELEERKKVDDLREQLLGVVGHDLRGPLASISMATNLMLKRGSLPDAEVKTAALIARNTDRMSRMVSQLLDFTRARLGGGIPIAPQQMDLAQLCSELIPECEAANPGREIAFDCDMYTTGIWDRDRLGQVIANLLGNAIQHGSATRPVSVRILDDGPDHIALSISNSGAPIPPEAQATIFDPFRRASVRRSSKDKSESLGLGLYIVREIVRAHEGTIDVESDERATTFNVRLPRTPSYRNARDTLAKISGPQ